MGNDKEYTGSFNEAFAAARKELGAGATFVWNGKKYTTNLKDEKVTPTPQTQRVTQTETPITEGVGIKGLTKSEVPALAKMADKGRTKDGGLSALAGAKTGGAEAAGSGLGTAAGYIPDLIKLGIGLTGATEKVPEYKIPSEFMDFKQRMKEMSTQGLTAEELATGQRNAERGYAYDVKGIEDFAGGRPGVALANLGRAAGTLQNSYNDINLADAQMRRQNMGNYGNVLDKYVGLDKDVFNQKYDQSVMNKQSGAQLAADALSNVESRMDYNKSYGENSLYAKYMKQLTEGQGLQNDLYQYQLSHPPDLNQGTYTPQSIPSNSTYNDFIQKYLLTQNPYE